jgi:dinuclear metal center YbgI/SA1388 family protein
MSASLQTIVDLLETQYPSAWAVPGDHSGLEVGHPDGRIATILMALEATPAVVREARAQGAQLLITHHPLLYRPLAAVREDQPLGEILAELLRAGIALVSCHTNLDVAPGGLNDYLAQRLELTGVEPLAPTTRDCWYKLVVFVPVGYEDRVRQALGDEGLGVIGRYSQCSFAGRGQGTYRPRSGARPFRGEVGQLSRAEESRLEILAPESLLCAALSRLRAVHPYEEMAYDLYPLKNPGVPLGLGRIGHWPGPRPIDAVIFRIKEVFGVESLRVWGRPPQEVQHVALCSGSGGDLISEARQKGAQVYLTGEVRHHQATPGTREDFAILEVGHFASEALFMEPWAEQLRHLFHDAGLTLKVAVAEPRVPYYFV